VVSVNLLCAPRAIALQSAIDINSDFIVLVICELRMLLKTILKSRVQCQSMESNIEWRSRRLYYKGSIRDRAVYI